MNAPPGRPVWGFGPGDEVRHAGHDAYVLTCRQCTPFGEVRDMRSEEVALVEFHCGCAQELPVAELRHHAALLWETDPETGSRVALELIEYPEDPGDRVVYGSYHENDEGTFRVWCPGVETLAATEKKARAMIERQYAAGVRPEPVDIEAMKREADGLAVVITAEAIVRAAWRGREETGE